MPAMFESDLNDLTIEKDRKIGYNYYINNNYK